MTTQHAQEQQASCRFRTRPSDLWDTASVLRRDSLGGRRHYRLQGPGYKTVATLCRSVCPVEAELGGCGEGGWRGGRETFFCGDGVFLCHDRITNIHGQSEDEGVALDVGISSRAGASECSPQPTGRQSPRQPSNLCFLGGGRAKPAEVCSPPVSLPGRF